MHDTGRMKRNLLYLRARTILVERNRATTKEEKTNYRSMFSAQAWKQFSGCVAIFRHNFTRLHHLQPPIVHIPASVTLNSKQEFSPPFRFSVIRTLLSILRPHRTTFIMKKRDDQLKNLLSYLMHISV